MNIFNVGQNVRPVLQKKEDEEIVFAIQELGGSVLLLEKKYLAEMEGGGRDLEVKHD